MADKKFEKIMKNIEKLDQDDANELTKKLEKERDIKERHKTFGTMIGKIFDKKELAQQLMFTHPIFFDKARNWWLWNHIETKWERVDETDIMNAVDRQATIKSINAKEKNEMLEALRQVGRLNMPSSIPPTWVQFQNIIYDVQTGEERKAIPEYFVTNPIPWELDINRFSQTPIIDKIFEEWVGEDYVETLYEILAYCLLPDYPIHRLFCLIGSGLNGKSCFLTLLKRFIGKNNCCSTELDTLIHSRFETTKLHKKLVCQMGETNFKEISQTSLLKKLTGGDLIGFEYKNKDLFDEVNYAKIIIATNNLPTTTDKTIGYYRRWMIIDFPNKFSEKEDILSTIPEEEYGALAVKCVFLLKDLLEKREFKNEGSVEDRIKRYEDHSNFLDKFVREFTIEKFDGYITKADFLKKFESWCREEHHRVMAENSVGKAMRKLGIIANRRSFDWAFDGRGGKIMIWEGISWVE